MDQRTKSGALLAFTLVFGVALSAAGAWWIVTWGEGRALEKSAQQSAADWAAYIAEALPEIGLLTAGAPITEEQQDFLENSKRVARIFRLRLRDEDGLLRFDSARPGLDAPDRDGLTIRPAHPSGFSFRSAAFNPAESGIHARATHPVLVEGVPIGDVEVLIDRTQAATELHSEFLKTVALTALLSAFVFLLPMCAFLWRSRQQLETQRRLVFVADHDSLTGLLNRGAFKRCVDARIAGFGTTRASRLFFIDIDKFKDVNDLKGHAAGDQLLCEVGARLRAHAVADSILCRLSGDEFAMYVPASAAGRCGTELAERLVEVLRLPFDLSCGEVSVGVSIGVAAFPADGATSCELLKAADLALYEAKRLGGGRTCLYEPVLERQRARRLEIEERLRDAVEKRDYALVYQPLYDTRSDTVAGFEALLRLKDGTGTPISPAEFIPVAEKTGLIVPLGAAVLEDACRTASHWPRHVSVAVNLSPVQFESGSLIHDVRKALATSGLSARRLELEVTESILMRNPDFVALQIDQLKEFGVSIALDDFGTGYSSLSYLWKFPFDKLKIDRSFIRNLSADDDRSRQVLETVVALGEVMCLGITAEGIETPAQADEVKRLRIHQVQGYLFGAPMAANEIDLTMLNRRPSPERAIS